MTESEMNEWKTSVQKLIAKARAASDLTEVCHFFGSGHEYVVDGFSRISHPETMFGDLPHVSDLEEVQFRSYRCRHCGKRVSKSEAREYQADKFLRQ